MKLLYLEILASLPAGIHAESDKRPGAAADTALKRGRGGACAKSWQSLCKRKRWPAKPLQKRRYNRSMWHRAAPIGTTTVPAPQHHGAAAALPKEAICIGKF